MLSKTLQKCRNSASVGGLLWNFMLLLIVAFVELCILVLVLDIGGFWGVVAYFTLRLASRLISLIRDSFWGVIDHFQKKRDQEIYGYRLREYRHYDLHD